MEQNIFMKNWKHRYWSLSSEKFNGDLCLFVVVGDWTPTPLDNYEWNGEIQNGWWDECVVKDLRWRRQKLYNESGKMETLPGDQPPRGAGGNAGVSTSERLMGHQPTTEDPGSRLDEAPGWDHRWNGGKREWPPRDPPKTKHRPVPFWQMHLGALLRARCWIQEGGRAPDRGRLPILGLGLVVSSRRGVVKDDLQVKRLVTVFSIAWHSGHKGLLYHPSKYW